jgi:hypothetical protein
MKATPISQIAEVLVASAGALLLIFGIWSFADPEIFAKLYSIDTSAPSATSAMRAMVGGGEIGLGLFLLLGRKLKVSLRSRLLLATFLFVCVFIARASAIALEWSEVSSGTIRELAIEGVLACAFVAFVALVRSIRRTTHYG